MWNPVGFVKCRYGCDEGGEGGDCMAGKGSVFAVRQWQLWWNVERGAGRWSRGWGKGGRGEAGGCYSASNWFGRIKSASRSRFL